MASDAGKILKTIEDNDERIGAVYAEALDRIADKWGRGG